MLEFQGDIETLGAAEKFVVELSKIEWYNHYISLLVLFTRMFANIIIIYIVMIVYGRIKTLIQLNLTCLYCINEDLDQKLSAPWMFFTIKANTISILRSLLLTGTKFSVFALYTI